MKKTKSKSAEIEALMWGIIFCLNSMSNVQKDTGRNGGIYRYLETRDVWLI